MPLASTGASRIAAQNIKNKPNTQKIFKVSWRACLLILKMIYVAQSLLSYIKFMSKILLNLESEHRSVLPGAGGVGALKVHFLLIQSFVRLCDEELLETFESQYSVHTPPASSQRQQQWTSRHKAAESRNKFTYSCALCSLIYRLRSFFHCFSCCMNQMQFVFIFCGKAASQQKQFRERKKAGAKREGELIHWSELPREQKN